MLAASRGLASHVGTSQLNRPLARPAPISTAPARSSIIVAVKPTKASDFQGLSNDEIFAKITDLKKELASARFLFRTRGIGEMAPGDSQPQPDPEKMPKPHVYKHLRRQIAQLWTIWRQREIKEGIDSRTSRKNLKQLVRTGM